MTTTRMFNCVTEKPWNPLGGRCKHNCIYCWSMGEKGLVKKYNMQKYQGEPRLIPKEFKRTFNEGGFCFVCDMVDLFGDWIPNEWINSILYHIQKFPKTTFLLLTKNPKRYHNCQIPTNCICGATIETDKYFGQKTMGFTPTPGQRWEALATLEHKRKMVSVEPIMNFNLEYFVFMMRSIDPEFIYVGYDNYENNLPEPSLEETMKLIEKLKEFTDVRTKTLR